MNETTIIADLLDPTTPAKPGVINHPIAVISRYTSRIWLTPGKYIEIADYNNDGGDYVCADWYTAASQQHETQQTLALIERIKDELQSLTV